MTKSELLKSILNDSENKGIYGSGIDAMIAYAYFAGREDATKELSDRYSKVIETIKDKINDDRYHKYLNSVVFGDYSDYEFYQKDQNFIYSSDYAGDFQATFGSDKIDDFGTNPDEIEPDYDDEER